MRAILTAGLSALLLLGGCATFPELGPASETARTAPWPVILPIDEVLARRDGADPQAPQADLDGRRARLAARARDLRRPVIESDLRERMVEMADRHD